MPQLIAAPIAAAFGGGLIATAVANLLVGVAFSALSTALQPGVKRQNQPGIITQFTGDGDVTPQSLILGRTATAGHKMCPDYTHDGEIGENANGGERACPDPFYGRCAKGQYLTRVISLADAPVSGLVGLYVDGILFPFSFFTTQEERGKGLDPGVLGAPGDYIGKLWIEFYDGTQTAPSAYLRNAYGNHPTRPWAAASIYRGGAYVVVTHKLDRDLYSKGKPELLFVVDGMPLLDPRTGTVGPTNNPALHAWHLFQTIPVGPYRYGAGKPRSALPDAIWFAAMNKCDLQVPDGDGGTERQYRSGLEIRIAQPEGGGMEPLDAIDTILPACSGAVAEVYGRIHIRAGSPALPVAAITDDAILVTEDEAHSPILALSEIFNSVAATYPEPSDKWAARDADVVTDAEAVEELGEVRQGSVDLKAAPYPNQVRRLMAAWLKDAARGRAHSFTLPAAWASRLVPLATIVWTSALHGYENKQFEIQEAVKDVQTGQVAVTLREVDPNDYDTTQVPIRPPSRTVDRIAVIPFTLGDLTLSPAIAKDANGVARRAGIEAVWTAGDRNLGRVRFEFRLAGTTGLVPPTSAVDGASGRALFFDGVLKNTAYEGRAQGVVRGTSIWTDWQSVITPDIGVSELDLDETFRNLVEDSIFQRDLQLIAFVEANEARVEQAKTVADLAYIGQELDDGLVAVRGEIQQARADGSLEVTVLAESIDGRVTEAVLAETGPGGTIAVMIEQVEAKTDANTADITEEKIARTDAESALAGQITTLSARVEPTIAVIRDINLSEADAQKWSRWTGAGTATYLNNAIYTTGKTVQFAVTETQLDGLQTASDRTTWIGPVNLDGYVVEVDYTLKTGVLSGAGVRITWAATDGTVYRTSMQLEDMSRSGASSRVQRASAVLLLPDGFAGTFDRHDVFLYANTNALGFTPSAKTIQFHRCVIRPATPEEMASGILAIPTEATITNTRLVRAKEKSAIARNVTELSARLGGTEGRITALDEVVTGPEGAVVTSSNRLDLITPLVNASSEVTQRITAAEGGGAIATIDVLANGGAGVAGFQILSGPPGTTTVVDMLGDVIRAGTLLADRLTTGQGRNLMQDSTFAQKGRNWIMQGDGNVFAQSILNYNPPGSVYGGLVEPTFGIFQSGAGLGGTATARARMIHPETQATTAGTVPTTPGEWWMVSARIYATRCTGQLIIGFLDATGTGIPGSFLNVDIPETPSSVTRDRPLIWPHYFRKAQAPVGAAFVDFRIAKTSGSTSATTNDSSIYWYQPQTEKTHAKAQEATPYSRGGVTIIDGGMIRTDEAFIGEAMLLNAIIGTAKIQDAAIVRAHMQNAIIGTAQVDNAAITNAKIANAAVERAQIGNLAVGTAQIDNLAVQTIKIADAAVTAGVQFVGTASINIAGENWFDIGVATLITTGSLLEIFGGAETFNEVGISYIRALVNGQPTSTVVFNDFGTSRKNGPAYLTFGPFPEIIGAGTHTVLLQARMGQSGESCSLRNRVLTLRTNKK